MAKTGKYKQQKFTIKIKTNALQQDSAADIGRHTYQRLKKTRVRHLQPLISAVALAEDKYSI